MRSFQFKIENAKVQDWALKQRPGKLLETSRSERGEGNSWCSLTVGSLQKYAPPHPSKNQQWNFIFIFSRCLKPWKKTY